MITLRANRTGRNILGSQANYPPSTQLGWPKTFVLSNIQILVSFLLFWKKFYDILKFLMDNTSVHP
jgi:hypothetical protein